MSVRAQREVGWWNIEMGLLDALEGAESPEARYHIRQALQHEMIARGEY